MNINGVQIKKVVSHSDIKSGQWPNFRTASLEEVKSRVKAYEHYHDKAVDVNDDCGNSGYVTKDGHFVRVDGVFVPA
jgi:hypothetical protein